MKRHKLRFISMLLTLWLLIHPTAESLVAPGGPLGMPVASLNAWIANFKPWAAAYALKHYSHRIGELSIFGVGGNAKGELAAEQEFISASLKAMRRHDNDARVLITVANNRRKSNGDRKLLYQWIGTPEQVERHIKDLVKLAQRADGLDIDYENLQPKDGPRYTYFVSQLAQALHARGKYLSVTVEPNTLLYGSINWTDLSSRVDRIRIMAYPFHYERTGPGAVSPPAIVKNLVQRALKWIPTDKLEIALPIYGFDWTSNGKVKLVATVNEFQLRLKKPGAKAFRDGRTRAARIEYSTQEGSGKNARTLKHHVWFEDPTCVAYKVQMLQRLGITHIGLWQLGVGDISELFDLIKTPSRL